MKLAKEALTFLAALVIAVRRLAEVIVALFGNVLAAHVADARPARAGHFIAPFCFEEACVTLLALTQPRLCHRLFYSEARGCLCFLLHLAAFERDVALLAAERARLGVAVGAAHDDANTFLDLHLSQR